MLRGKRIVIAGAGADGSLAYVVAERALRAGAFVTLAAAPDHFARCRELVERLPWGAHAVRVDLTGAGGVATLHEHLRCAYRTVDGAVHAVADDPAGFAALTDAVARLLPAGAGSLVGVTSAQQADRSTFEQANRIAGALRSTGARVDLVLADADERAVAEAACVLLDGLPIDGGRAPHVEPSDWWSAVLPDERVQA